MHKEKGGKKLATGGRRARNGFARALLDLIFYITLFRFFVIFNYPS